MSGLLRRAMPALLIVSTVALFAWTQDTGQERDDKNSDGAGENAGHNHAAPPSPAVGEKAENFTTETMSGKKIELHESYKGKLVLIDFWATWCGPCVREIPHLVEANEKYGQKGLVILGVTLDGPRIPAEKVTAFTEKNDMPWEQIYDDAREIAQAYQVSSIPTPILIDGDSGKILALRGELRGASLDEALSKHVGAKMREIKKKGGTSTP